MCDAGGVVDSNAQTVDVSLTVVQNMLDQLLQKYSSTFLVVDDVDACGSRTALLIEKHLREMQRKNVRILVTSRISLHQIYYNLDCDLCSQRAFVWWTCELCQNGSHYPCICNDCKEEQGSCSHWYVRQNLSQLNPDFASIKSLLSDR